MRIAMRIGGGLVALLGLAGCPLEDPWADEAPATTATVHGLWAGDARPTALSVAIEGELRDVALAADGSFRVDGVPPGDRALYVVAGQRRGRADLDGLEAGERVHLIVRTAPKGLDVDVERRVRSDDLAPLEIHGNGVVHRLPPGEIHNDVEIHGNDVEVIGVAGRDCADPRRTVLFGRLRVNGNDVTVEGVDLRGPASIHGNDVEVDARCGW